MDKLRVTVAFRLDIPAYLELEALAKRDTKGNISEVARRVVELGLGVIRQEEAGRDPVSA